jgi:hypothetical protein
MQLHANAKLADCLGSDAVVFKLAAKACDGLRR